MQFKKFSQLFLFLILPLIWTACSDDEINPNEEPSFDHIVSYELIDNISKDEINSRFNNSPLASGFVNFDVKAYKLTYMTPYFDGTEVEASGLVLIPQVSGSVKPTSFQHSTLAKSTNLEIDREHRAPSYLSSESAEIYLSAVLYASNGYMISAADYIGYGSTSDMFHPYEHAESAAIVSFDMLVAAKELAKFLEVKMTNDLFLLGYSQGGNSTMALHKYIEENHASEFTITRSAMGAGAYHKSAVGDYIFNSQEPLGLPITLYLWVLDSYDRIYLQNGMDYYLKEQYATEVTTNGYFAISNTNPLEIFTDGFIADINNPSSGFRQALADNDIHDWKAIAPIKLFHSRDDGLVPYFNSAVAYDNMKAKGSTDILLETYDFPETFDPNDIHGAAGARFFTDVISVYFQYGL